MRWYDSMACINVSHSMLGSWCLSRTNQGCAAARRGHVERKTKETQVAVSVDLDGTGKSSIDTPVPFLNHMLDVRTHPMLETVR